MRKCKNSRIVVSILWQFIWQMHQIHILLYIEQKDSLIILSIKLFIANRNISHGGTSGGLGTAVQEKCSRVGGEGGGNE